MQREAEERVREMQSRARLVGGAPSPRPTKSRAQNSFSTSSSPLPFGLDNDKMIILALLWVLYNEGADSKLLLALLYLLM